MNACDLEDPVCVATYLTLAMLSAGLVLALIRLLKGPTTPDRVVALELVGLLALGIIATSAIASDESSLLAAALVLGLIGFLATVSFARYLEKTRTR
jgi:multicomponent Na+:H+ antiporter subunit F